MVQLPEEVEVFLRRVWEPSPGIAVERLVGLAEGYLGGPVEDEREGLVDAMVPREP